MYNLEEWNDKRHIRTVLYNKPYQLCIGIKKQLEGQRHAPNTYFKIKPN